MSLTQHRWSIDAVSSRVPPPIQAKRAKAGGAREAGGAIEGTLRPAAMMLAPSESYRGLLTSFQASPGTASGR